MCACFLLKSSAVATFEPSKQMVSEELYQVSIEENKQLTQKLLQSDQKIAALALELENIKRAIFVWDP